MGGEAGAADAGAASVALPVFPARPLRCEVWDAQESELHDPSKVLLPGHCRRFRASAGGDRVAPEGDPAPAAPGYLALGAVGEARGTRGGRLHASPGEEMNFATSELARLPDLKHLGGGAGR